jgi:hypothetical protein
LLGFILDRILLKDVILRSQPYNLDLVNLRGESIEVGIREKCSVFFLILTIEIEGLLFIDIFNFLVDLVKGFKNKFIIFLVLGFK